MDKANDNRNVIDYYKGWEDELIKADLERNRTDMVNVCMNLTGDFNKGSVIRANNAFRGSRVYIVGRKKYDTRGTVGTRHYEHINFEPEIEPVLTELKNNGYKLFAVDNTPEFNPQSISSTEFPEKSAFIYGEEKVGLSREVVDLCDASIYIPQHGSVRSLNVAQAAAIVMYEYDRQLEAKDEKL